LAANPSASGPATLRVSGVSGGATHSADIQINVTPAFFVEGAESAPGPMRVTAPPPAQTTWFRTSSDAASGTFAWQVGAPPGGAYGALADARLTSPPFDLSGATTAGRRYRY